MSNTTSPHEVGANRTLLARTCNKCGHLKQGHEYRFFNSTHKGCKTPTRTRQTWCHDCMLEWTRLRAIRENHKSWDKATHHRERWSQAELDHLYMLHGVEYPWKVIAEILGRSLSAVTTMYHKQFAGESTSE